MRKKYNPTRIKELDNDICNLLKQGTGYHEISKQLTENYPEMSLYYIRYRAFEMQKREGLGSIEDSQYKAYTPHG